MSEHLYIKELKLENGSSLWWGGDKGWVSDFCEAITINGMARNRKSGIGKTVKFKRVVDEDIADEVAIETAVRVIVNAINDKKTIDADEVELEKSIFWIVNAIKSPDMNVEITAELKNIWHGGYFD